MSLLERSEQMQPQKMLHMESGSVKSGWGGLIEMAEMTSRECFRAVMNFKKPDRLPWYEWPWNEAIYRWIMEGLPISEIMAQREEYDMSVLPYSISVIELDVSKYFGFENFSPPEYTISIDANPIPRYFAKTLEETDDY